jgi:hypothetical protein
MEVNGRLHASDALHPGKEPPVPGCVGPRAGVDVFDERKSLAPAGKWTTIPRSSRPWPPQYTEYVIASVFNILLYIKQETGSRMLLRLGNAVSKNSTKCCVKWYSSHAF